MLLDIVSLSAPQLIALALIVCAALWYRYTCARDKYLSGGDDDRKTRHVAGRAPPRFPYLFPLVGSIPLGYLPNPKDFVLNPKNPFRAAYPTLVKLWKYDFYLVQGPENVKAMFEKSHLSTSVPLLKYSVADAFGLPAKGVELYDKDDSGGNAVPHPDSNVEPRNRVDYNVHRSLLRLLEGPGFLRFYQRLQDNLTEHLYNLHDRLAGSGVEGELHDDMFAMFRDMYTVPTFNAFCGEYLLKLHPGFVDDFWKFDRDLQIYLQRVPWFLAPWAYATRKRAINAVKDWHLYARENYRDDPAKEIDDPFWGSFVFRERDNMMREMDGYDDEAIACQGFALIWATRSSMLAACWAVIELFRDPELLAAVREEVKPCTSKDAEGRVSFDIDKLLRLPILQAVYAETLRQRMHFFLIRCPDRTDIKIRDWIIPKRKTALTLTTVEHYNPENWNTGPNNEHPVDQF